MKNKARNKFTSPHFFMPKMMIIKSWMILPNNSIIFMHRIKENPNNFLHFKIILISRKKNRI